LKRLTLKRWFKSVILEFMTVDATDNAPGSQDSVPSSKPDTGDSINVSILFFAKIKN
jgi:hypothetical protein